MKFSKILLHTRFREMAYNSLEAVLELKKAGLEEIVLTHIIPTDEVGFVPYGGFMKEEAERHREKARAQFVDWQPAIEAAGVRSKIRVEVGAVVPKILSIAEEEDVQLIVAGRKKRTLLEVVYVGSHILDLLRRSPLPVLMGKYMVQFEVDGEKMTRTNDHIFQRPMLATDWSAPSEKALDALLALKGVAEKALVTHVLCDKITKGLDADGLKALEKESRRRLDAYRRKLEDGGLPAESHLSFGHAAREIINMAREYSASMIVMGRTGKDWFEEYWLGGVSHKVAESSELPVMLIP